jgi:hypothetical protein
VFHLAVIEVVDDLEGLRDGWKPKFSWSCFVLKYALWHGLPET